MEYTLCNDKPVLLSAFVAGRSPLSFYCRPGLPLAICSTSYGLNENWKLTIIFYRLIDITRRNTFRLSENVTLQQSELESKSGCIKYSWCVGGALKQRVRDWWCECNQYCIRVEVAQLIGRICSAEVFNNLYPITVLTFESYSGTENPITNNVLTK